MSELSESEKATFKAATERRKAAGIKLKRFGVLADETQVAALNELWDAWVIRWGKQRAVDNLISVMSTVEARQRDKENAR